MLREYLSALTSKGKVHSQGHFTLDAGRALGVMGIHALPSRLHALLKVVQVANRLGAASVLVSVSHERTRLDFNVDERGVDSLLEALPRSLEEATRGVESLARDVSLALYGSVSSSVLDKASWSVSRGEQVSTLRLSSDFASAGVVVSSGSGENSGACSFVVSHPWTWRFWETARRKARVAKLLAGKCAFSPARIVVEGKPLQAPGGAFFNEHLREFYGSQFNVASGVMETTKARVAATSMLFALATEAGPSFAFTAPGAEHYAVRGGDLNIWTHALKRGNALRPDGDEVCAWMLQFVRDGERVARGEADRFEAVMAFNIHGPGNSDRPKVLVVRHGVLVHDARFADDSEEMEPFRGCHLLFADDDGLKTDAGGFALVVDDEFRTRVLDHLNLIDLGHEFFEEAMFYAHLP